MKTDAYSGGAIELEREGMVWGLLLILLLLLLPLERGVAMKTVC